MKNVKQAYIALNRYALTMNEGVKQLRETFIKLEIATVEDASPIVMGWISDKYDCPLTISESNRNKGDTVLDRDSPNFANAVQAFKRAMKDLMGDADKTSARSEGDATEEAEIEVPADIAALAARLVKMCNEYKGAKRLASKALAEAFAAAKAK